MSRELRWLKVGADDSCRRNGDGKPQITQITQKEDHREKARPAPKLMTEGYSPRPAYFLICESA
jgi:hypothetical protein